MKFKLYKQEIYNFTYQVNLHSISDVKKEINYLRYVKQEKSDDKCQLFTIQPVFSSSFFFKIKAKEAQEKFENFKDVCEYRLNFKKMY